MSGGDSGDKPGDGPGCLLRFGLQYHMRRRKLYVLNFGFYPQNSPQIAAGDDKVMLPLNVQDGAVKAG
jgi:hypothetical protein